MNERHTTSSAPSAPPTPAGAAPTRARAPRRMRALWLLVAVCLAPVIASYVAFYVVKPQTRNNYGTLIEPQRPVPALGAVRLEDGKPFELAALRGKWIMLATAPAACDTPCAERLYIARQVRASTGKERERIERVWIVNDAGTPPAKVLEAHEGLHVLRAPAEPVRAFLPATNESAADDHLYLIDPLGHLMMRWPKDVDPARLRRDVSRLLRASRVG